MKVAFLSLVVAAGLFQGLGQSQQTIPELARQRPSNPVVRGLMQDIPMLPLEELVKGADAVVEGTLSLVGSRLSDNQLYLTTEYNILPLRVLSGRLPVAADRPAQSKLVLTVRGGSYTLDGFTVYDVDHTREKLKNGGRYLLFLKAWKTPGVYTLYGTGAFELNADRLTTPNARNSSERYSDLMNQPYESILATIATVAKR